MGRRDNAHIHLPCLLLADTFILAFLQHAQELALQIDGDFPDFVEKERPAVGGFEPPGPIFDGTAEGAFHMTEKFAFIEFPAVSKRS